MKVCNMCGCQIQDNYNACPQCGNSNLVMQQPMGAPYGQQQGNMYGQQYSQPTGNMYGQQPMNNQYGQPLSQEKGSIGYGVLGFLIPLVGLVLYLSWKDTKPGDAKMAGKGALISVIISVVFYVLAFIIALFVPLFSSLS